MSRFYFQIRSGDQFVSDDEGVDLPNFDAAMAEAVLSAREIIAETIRNGDPVPDDVIEITDEAGTVLGAVPLRSVIRLN